MTDAHASDGLEKVREALFNLRLTDDGDDQEPYIRRLILAIAERLEKAAADSHDAGQDIWADGGEAGPWECAAEALRQEAGRLLVLVEGKAKEDHAQDRTSTRL